MGGISSCCVPRQGYADDNESGRAASTPRKRGRHGRTLSATFNLSLVDEASRSLSLVNVNTANEEELMTLPGINRSIAKSIIEYRNHIGGFRCAEDIALVSGVGAEKLTSIRSDIYVVPPATDHSCRDNLAATSEHISESSTDDGLVICVNTSNIFSLLRVKGIGMTLAKNIVTYRDTHGKFHSLDELLKVKGIGPGNLEVIRPYLSLRDTAQNGKASGIHHSNGSVTRTSSCDNYSNNAKRAISASMEELLQILGPLAKVPTRPKVNFVSLKHKNRNVFRLASWNLKKFTLEKANNPGVREAVCMTILENGFGIVCVQELADVDALKVICDELNSPTLPNGKKWGGRRGEWAYEVSKPTGRMFQGTEYHGFLYDKSQKISLQSSCVIAKAPNKKRLFSRMPFVGIFSIDGGFDCLIVSVHLKAAGLKGEDQQRTEKEAQTLNDILEAVKDTFTSERDIIFLGDFNLSPDSSAFDGFRSDGYVPCIPPTTFTNISNNNPQGSMNYDNIWVSRQTQRVSTGVSGVVRDGLSNAWIPNGWSWGGTVSDHCPVFTQLYSKMDLDKEEINVADVRFLLGGTDGV
ncbi:endonuclease/exonuclease/phosphatase family domain-containing protein 1 [Plakobranchus ocellatus]|uniref:Endonuclease/exonuclease/phosphatase family domain-containing protein 1 n=1 Tax=Plakobranchus ocellatus TaxID=259542 RepID=A0AAV4C2Q6_9GAST|nr:endonuclease/exonuclease/phosphatase family domain-containing protein 1 [Plakobranchus ocellatus]